MSHVNQKKKNHHFWANNYVRQHKEVAGTKKNILLLTVNHIVLLWTQSPKTTPHNKFNKR